MKLFEGVNNFTIVNDPSERVVQLAEKRIKSVRSETRFQDTLLSVHELNLLCHGIKRDSFDKRELQIIVKKMMMKKEESLESKKAPEPVLCLHLPCACAMRLP